MITNFRFPGQYFDTESELHYNHHRYYDPSLGRYLRPDPIGLAGGVNLYLYAFNNPVNLIDPFGLDVADAGLLGELAPSNPWIYNSLKWSGSLAFIDFVWEIDNRCNEFGQSKRTDNTFTNSLAGWGFQIEFMTDLPKFGSDNVAFNFGVGSHLGISYYPRTGNISINTGWAAGPPIGISVPLGTIDHSKIQNSPHEGPMM